MRKHFITNIFPLRVPTLMPCYLNQNNWGIQSHIHMYHFSLISAPAHTLHTNHLTTSSYICLKSNHYHSVLLEVLLNILKTFHR